MLIPVNELIEAINDGFVMVDAAWQITHVNQRARAMWRLGDGTSYPSLWSIVPDDPTTPARRELDRAQRLMVTVEFDVFYPQLYVWHEVRAVPTAQGLALLLRDITDRQWLLRREAERAYMRNLFDDAPVALSITRGLNHQFEFVNQVARQLVGDRVMEGRTYREVFPELAEQGFIHLLDQVYRSGTAYHATEQPVRFDRHRTGHPEESYFTFTYQPLRGFDNQISGILTLAVEVTVQVRAHQAAAQQAAVQEAILRQLPEGVIVTDVAGRITYVNDMAAQLHGVTALAIGPDAYAATYQLFTMDGAPYPPTELPLARAVREHVVVTDARWQICRPDGSWITVKGTARPVVHAGSVVGAVLTIHQIAVDTGTTM